MRAKAFIFLILVIIFTAPFKQIIGQDEPKKQDTTIISKPHPIPIESINYEIEKVHKRITRMQYELEPNPAITNIDTLLFVYSDFLKKEAEEFKKFNPNNLSTYFLESTYRSWEGFNIKLDEMRSIISNHLKTIQNDIAELTNMNKLWRLTLDKEKNRNIPEELAQRIANIIIEANESKNKFENKRLYLFKLEDKITELISFNNDIIEDVKRHQQLKRDNLFVGVSPPLWKVTLSKSDINNPKHRLSSAWHENAKNMMNYLHTIKLGSLFLTILIITLIFLLLRWKYTSLGLDDSESGHKGIMRILDDNPFIALGSIILVTYHLFFPFQPLVFSNLLTLLLLINMRFILSSFIDPEDKKIIVKLIILLIVNNLEIFFWYFGNLSRYYLLFEELIGIALLYKYTKPSYWKNFKKLSDFKKFARILAYFVVAFYSIALIANIFGFQNVVVLFSRVAIHVPEFTIVLLGVSKITKAVVRALIEIGESYNLSGMVKYWGIIEKRSMQIISTLIIGYWVFSLAVSFDIARPIMDWLLEFNNQKRTIGTITISIGQLLTFVFILLIIYGFSVFFKTIVEGELLSRTKLSRGVSAAISVTIRYFVITLGIIFALSAAGIDLGRFSLIAGALGVGIGFGLQNIVSNFISGLILIYERPIQAGDTIEVEDLIGKVKSIGVRASNVVTYDGAEVVVPNGNLISNQLINWTLSDNKRRVEIKVGVAYGADPNIVLKLLKQVAMRNEDVIKDPEPRALFDEFGDSSLNFRLLYWVPFESGVGTKSDISIGIYNILAENDIQIPFPQIDVHMIEKESKTELDKNYSEEKTDDSEKDKGEDTMV
jgi:small-conductance mechanosensitive channel